MIARTFGLALFWASLASPLAAQSSVSQAAGQIYSRPIALARPVFMIKREDAFGYGTSGWLCILPRKMTWGSDEVPKMVEQFLVVFQDEMKNIGFKIVGDRSKIFEDRDDESSEYALGASIGRMDMRVCYPDNRDNFETSKGTGEVDVEWQIYSRLQRKVVLSLTITGTSKRDRAMPGGAFGLAKDAFRAALRKLAADDRFTKLLSAPVGNPAVARIPPPGLVALQVKQVVSVAVSLNEVVASTVVIFANGGEGSGFLISPDGYVLTNHHVVGDSQYVKVRWSDGAEQLGEVIRSDKGRDIALVKTDAKGRKSLPLRAQPVLVGEDIYAVGAPTGAEFQNTVTKGIVSASRVFNGYNFIQSDVAVTHGNSGGPIVDAKGQVVGLTDLGIDGAPMLNLFIPIGEALGFLGLQMTP